MATAKRDEILTCCPTCGGKLDNSGTKVDLDDNFIMHNDRVSFVPPAVAEILHVLHKKMPAVVRRETIIKAVWGGLDEPEGVDRVLSVHVCRANKVLEPLGLAIETAWGTGYSLREKKRSEVTA